MKLSLSMIGLVVLCGCCPLGGGWKCLDPNFECTEAMIVNGEAICIEYSLDDYPTTIASPVESVLPCESYLRFGSDGNPYCPESTIAPPGFEGPDTTQYE